MPAYNPPQQILPQPVTSFYKGKAIRLQQEMAEKELEQADDLLDIKKREIDLKENIFEQDQQEAQRDLQLRSATASILAYDAAKGTEEERRAAGFEAGIAVLDDVLPGGRDEVIAQLEKDGKPATPDLFDPKATRALLADPDSYFAVQEANAKLTADEKLIGNMLADDVITEDEAADLRKRIAEKRATIVGRTPEDVASDPRTGSQRGAAYQVDLNEFQGSGELQEMIGASLPRVEELPKAVGFTGKAAMGGAGFLSAMGQEELAEGFAEYVAGADSETISALMTQLQTVRGRIIPILTGEKGTRISETEREVANRAVAIIDQIRGPADLTKSYPQVIGALKQLYEETWASKYRVAKKQPAIDYPYDLNKKSEVVELIEEMARSGMDRDSISRSITRLRSIQGIENAN